MGGLLLYFPLSLLLTIVSCLKFEGQEHKRLVDDVFAEFRNIRRSGQTLQHYIEANEQLANGNRFEDNPDNSADVWMPFLSPAGGKGKEEVNRQWYTSLGQITAMAGDYYGPESFYELLSEDHPGRHHNFLKIFKQFVHKSPFDLVRQWDFLKRIGNEGVKWNEWKRDHRGQLNPEAVYDDIGIQSRMPATLNHVIDLAYYNSDHFFPEAFHVARSLHGLAIRLITEWNQSVEEDGNMAPLWNIEAKFLSTDTTRGPSMAALKMALAVEGFSLHYLTDIFSAGHLRTPRPALSGDLSGCGKQTAGFTVKVQHDEDSLHGIYVRDLLQNSWLCKGDATLYHSQRDDNLKRAKEAVKASLYSLLHAGGFDVKDITFQWTGKDKATVQRAPNFVKFKIQQTCDLYSDDTLVPCPMIFIPRVDNERQLRTTAPNRCPRYLDDNGILRVRQKCNVRDGRQVQRDFGTTLGRNYRCCYRQFSRAALFSLFKPDDCCTWDPKKTANGIFSCGANDDAEDIED